MNGRTFFGRSQAQQLLRRAVADPRAEFRYSQWEAIDAVVNRRRKLLIVERTGWGKSIVYFVATRALRDQNLGPTLIVSPLLALMRNQMEAAERLGIVASSINSTNRDEWQELARAVRDGRVDALLISPERLANDSFVEEVLLPIANRIGLVVIDEAHCISDWGHDFRPDYRRLVNVLKHMPVNMPILGTTATANNRVLNDIKTQLGDIQIQRGPLGRETLALQTIRLPDQAARLAWLAEYVPKMRGTGIIYTLTKRDAAQVAQWLTKKGVNAAAYYSDVEAEGFADSDTYRRHLENQLLKNEIKALVATSALGMGYDKPDLGFVIHYQAPSSIIAYYQQVGRAGRGIDRALGVLLAGREDVEIHDYFRSTAFPEQQHVSAILGALARGDGLTTRELEETINLRNGQIEQALKFLSVESPAPVIKDGSRWRRTRADYRMDCDHIQRLCQQRQHEWQEVQNYIDSGQCLMMFLARALDDPRARPCGRCALCLRRPIVPASFSHHLAVDAARFVRQSELPLECNKQAPRGAFVEYGFGGNLPQGLRAEIGRVLSRAGDAGWGKTVTEDRDAGRFRDELVNAAAEMIRERWRPQPTPAWVTCVPSRSNPVLVPDFARRLARALRLPFIEAVKKVRDNQRQNLQHNRYHRCRNLDGAFAIVNSIPKTPVLLVDDTIDSVWTMTAVAALLRRHGSGPVWPFALASSTAGD
jgi:ATP-dependent DNA helicase RecQ